MIFCWVVYVGWWVVGGGKGANLYAREYQDESYKRGKGLRGPPPFHPCGY